MTNVAVVILNYMNYQETMSCVDSVLKQKYVDYKIVVVDNGSTNESYEVLQQRYRKNTKVNIIRARKNYGFAKGNNIGIRYAKEHLCADFVLLINSDTELIDESYISIMISYATESIGVIGSRIVLRNGKQQKKYYEYVDFPAVLYQYVLFYATKHGMESIAKKMEERLLESKAVEILHGCAFMLTPAFFDKYFYLYDKTFLYTEEILLYLLCRRAGLKQEYVDSTQIYHKEDQSSKYLFENKVSAKNEYVLASYKYVVWECFKDFVMKG